MAEAITLADAKRYFSRELGCSITSDEYLLDPITEALEYVLHNGGGQILREWKVRVKGGRFTLPRDLETPLKYKFFEDPTFGYGTVYTPYYSYGSQGVKSCCDYNEWGGAIEQKAGRVFTQYRLPKCGAKLIVTTCSEEDVDKKVIINGKWKGKDIAVNYFGDLPSGEPLPVQHINSDHIVHSAYTFDEITGVTIEEGLTDYIMLSAIGEDGKQYFLSHYHPDERQPSYRECEWISCPKACCEVTIHILGRVSASIIYRRDQDVLPITSLSILRFMAQRAKYLESGEFDKIATLEGMIKSKLKAERNYQESPNKTTSYKLPPTGAYISNT